MGIKEYLKESPKTFAFWISPKGEITGGMRSHISMVIQSPEKFGLTRDYIKDLFDKYDEKFGFEGKAREEIMKRLISEGFIRIRKYGNSGWVIDVNKMTKKMKERITKWAEKITDKGISGVQENSPHTIVTIVDETGYKKKLTIEKLAAGYILFESMTKDMDLIECKSIAEFSDYKSIL